VCSNLPLPPICKETWDSVGLRQRIWDNPLCLKNLNLGFGCSSSRTLA
jgi:hypothetical protein